MESAYRILFRNASPCVVLVEQVGRIDYFCIGSIIQSEDESTFVLTQTSILHSHSCASFSVRFSDGHKQPAVVILCGDQVCILRTKYYPKCKVLQFFEGEINFTNAAAIAPSSNSSVYNIPGFIIQKSLEAGGDKPGTTLPNYEHQFIFSGRYGDLCPNGISRLITGPVFNMDCQALGFVMEDLRYKHWLKEDEQTINKENYIEQGFFLKVCITAAELEGVLAGMLKNADWRRALKALGGA